MNRAKVKAKNLWPKKTKNAMDLDADDENDFEELGTLWLGSVARKKKGFLRKFG